MRDTSTETRQLHRLCILKQNQEWSKDRTKATRNLIQNFFFRIQCKIFSRPSGNVLKTCTQALLCQDGNVHPLPPLPVFPDHSTCLPGSVPALKNFEEYEIHSLYLPVTMAYRHDLKQVPPRL